MKKTIERKEELKNKLYTWVEKVLNSYDSNTVDGVDTYRMISDVDKIIADAFEHDTVL